MMMMFENVVAGVVCVRWVCARWAEQRESVEVEGPTGHQSERDGRTVHIVVVVVRDNCQQQLCTRKDSSLLINTLREGVERVRGES